MIESHIVAMKELIRAAYLTLLCRPPESEEVISAKAAALKTPEEVLWHFLASPEFLTARPEFYAAVKRGQISTQQAVNTKITKAELESLFERIRQQWHSLGASEPYWSVLTNDRYRLKQFAEYKKEFEDSGLHSVQLLELAAARSHAPMPTGVCLELGCGVGRVTRYLADKFETVIGVDISEGNLSICRKYLSENGKSNADIRLLRKPADIENLPNYDMFYSVIVLQHNPPPVIRYFLSKLLKKVRPGGAAYFQVPTHTPNYNFSLASYFESKPEILDMHLLPMPDVFDCIDGAGMKVREVLIDNSTGMYGSHSFYAVKPTNM